MKNQAQFNLFKKDAMANEPLMRQANLADVTFVNENTISFNGSRFRCANNVIDDYAKLVGVPQAFSNSIDKAFGKDTQKKIVELSKAARIAGGKNVQITLVANKKLGMVERILPAGKILPYEMYFNLFDRMMNNSKMEIKDFSQSSGGLFINTVSKENEFDIKGFTDETFHPGMTFTNNLFGAKVDSFVERLVCSNGMVGKGFAEEIVYNPENMNEFFEKIQHLKSTGFLPTEFSNKVASAIHTRASYAEVESATKLITGYSKLEKAVVDRFVPFNEINNKFAAKGCDVKSWNQQQKQNAITNISVWDVINGVTDFASHDYGFELSAAGRLDLQVKAGSMLSRDKFDTQNLVHVSL